MAAVSGFRFFARAPVRSVGQGIPTPPTRRSTLDSEANPGATILAATTMLGVPHYAYRIYIYTHTYPQKNLF